MPPIKMGQHTKIYLLSCLERANQLPSLLVSGE